MAKRGRPRGVNLNPVAVEDLLIKAGVSKREFAESVEITTGNLADLLYRRKGTSMEVIGRMCVRLGCRPETIAPGLLDMFVAVREGDPHPEEAVAS